MTHTESAQFVIETISTAKYSMLKNGVVDEKLIHAVCSKLAHMLCLDIYTIFEIFDAV